MNYTFVLDRIKKTSDISQFSSFIIKPFDFMIDLFIYEPRHDKTCLREFPTRPDTNQPSQP